MDIKFIHKDDNAESKGDGAVGAQGGGGGDDDDGAFIHDDDVEPSPKSGKSSSSGSSYLDLIMTAVHVARGQYLMFLEADNIIQPKLLFALKHTFESHAEVYSQTTYSRLDILLDKLRVGTRSSSSSSFLCD